MTRFHSPNPPDFDPLRSFLQANAPQSPEPRSDLEAQLMESIEALPQEPVFQRKPIMQRISKRWWVLSATIVTSVGLLWMGRSWQLAQRPLSSPTSDAELLALQDFLEDTWGVVGYVDTTDTWSNTTWITLSRTDPL